GSGGSGSASSAGGDGTSGGASSASGTATADHAGPITIDLTAGNSAETRAFNPSTNEKTGRITLKVVTTGMPAGAKVKWVPVPKDNVPDDKAAVVFGAADKPKTDVYAVTPGLHLVELQSLDQTNTVMASARVRLSIPQFFFVVENDFDTALSSLRLAGQKSQIVGRIEQLL